MAKSFVLMAFRRYYCFSSHLCETLSASEEIIWQEAAQRLNISLCVYIVA